MHLFHVSEVRQQYHPQRRTVRPHSIALHPAHAQAPRYRAGLAGSRQATGLGACRVGLETDTDNVTARTLYAAVGYEWLRDKEVYMLFL